MCQEFPTEGDDGTTYPIIGLANNLGPEIDDTPVDSLNIYAAPKLSTLLWFPKVNDSDGGADAK